jgi:hypothetical protein
VARADGAVGACEDLCLALKREVAAVLRASRDAEHMYGVLARQLDAGKDRHAQAHAAWHAPSSRASSSSSSHSHSPGGAAVKAAEQALGAVRRLLLELRAGAGHGDAASLPSQLHAALRNATQAVSGADRAIDDETAALAAAEQRRTVFLGRLGELAMQLQGAKAAAEACGKDVSDLVALELAAAQEAVARAAAAIDAVGAASPEALLSAHRHRQDAEAAADQSGSDQADSSWSLAVVPAAAEASSDVAAALAEADGAVAAAGAAVAKAADDAAGAGRELRRLRDKARQSDEAAQVVGERAVCCHAFALRHCLCL